MCSSRQKPTKLITWQILLDSLSAHEISFSRAQIVWLNYTGAKIMDELLSLKVNCIHMMTLTAKLVGFKAEL
jgi:hypothetical protein